MSRVHREFLEMSHLADSDVLILSPLSQRSLPATCRKCLTGLNVVIILLRRTVDKITIGQSGNGCGFSAVFRVTPMEAAHPC